MNEARKFTYYLKLHSGQLVYSDGTGWEEAAREAGIDPSEVKRHLPTSIVKTEAEKEASRKRVSKMLEKKRQQESEETDES